MSISGGSAAVQIQEIDLSTRVPGFPGVYGALEIPCTKGPIDEPQLMTSETQLLNIFTPLGKIEVGDSLAFFSATAFLSKSNKLWVKRIVGDNYLSGGIAVRQLGQAANIGWVAGLQDPTAYTFGAFDKLALYQSDPGDWSAAIALKVWLRRIRESVVLNATNVVNLPATQATGVLDSEITITAVAGAAGNLTINLVGGAPSVGAETAVKVGSVVTVTINNGASTQNHIRTALLTLLGVFSTIVCANPTQVWTLGVGTDTVTLTGGTDASSKISVTQQFVSGEPIRFSMLTTGIGDQVPGGLDVINTFYTIADTATTIKVANTLDNALNGIALVLTSVGQGTMQLVPMKTATEEDSFLIEVFAQSNLNIPLESWTVSLTPGAKNGLGQSMYIEDILAGSNYIRALINPLVGGDPRPQVTPLYMSGGDDGDPITDGKMMLGADWMQNQETFPITVIMDGGWATPAYQKYIDGIAQNRHDCVCFLSVPYEREAASNYLNEIADYWLNVLNLSSSFSALYTPHVKVYDKFNDRALFVSPDGFCGAALSNTALNYEMWFPIAGFRRGQINVLDLRRRFTRGEMDYLYDSVLPGCGGINPLRFAPGRGILIWGNKTLLGRPSVLSRLHVRCLLTVLEPAFKLYLEDFLFELNDEATRAQVKDGLEDYLSGIKARRGVTDFLVKCDAENNLPSAVDAFQMFVDLYIKPTPDVEYIPARVVIMRTGMSFALGQSIVQGG